MMDNEYIEISVEQEPKALLNQSRYLISPDMQKKPRTSDMGLTIFLWVKPISMCDVRIVPVMAIAENFLKD